MTGGLAPMLLAACVCVLGLVLVVIGTRLRKRRGLGSGQTLSLDRVTLTSRRYGLTGRPDRLVGTQGTIIPEEWKSSRVLRSWHRAQMGVYFLLVEEHYGVKPPYGMIVCGDGTRHNIANTAELRAWVLGIAEQIRAARCALGQPIPVHPKPGQCRPCGMRPHCPQARP